MSGQVSAKSQAPPIGGRGFGRIQIGTAVSLGPTSAGRLMALAAAAAPVGSVDAVDLALVAQTRAYYDEVPMPAAVVVSFDPACRSDASA